MSTVQSTKNQWLILTLGSAVGAIASFIQIIERIDFAENRAAPLACNINSVFSCSNVFDAWQSSVFGFSNSIMCLAFFAIMLGVGLAGLFGGRAMARGLRLAMHFFSVFFLGFGAWYLQQSAFAVRALCVFCIFCYAGVIAINWAWLRINVLDLPVSESVRATLQRGMKHGADTFFWVLWALAIAGMFVLAFK